MRKWLNQQWIDIRGNFKFWLLLSLPATYGGLKAVWEKLSNWDLFLVGLAIISGYLIAGAFALQLKSGQGLIIHYAGYGMGAGQYRDVTTVVRAHVINDKLDINVTNDILNCDPFPGIKKFLLIQYSYGENEQKEVVRKENDRCLLPDLS
jgi:hypothetical protein